MALTQSTVIFFLTLFLFVISIQTSLVYTIRQPKQQSSSKVFTLSLHHRNSITKPQNQNYTALKLSRLASDLARLNYINSRIRHAISNSDTNVQLENLQTPISPIDDNLEYAAHIWVGKPAKEFYLLVDTGSDVNWIQCLPCVDCYEEKTNPMFDPSKSSTYRPLPCASKQCHILGKTAKTKCSAVSNFTCSYTLLYGSGASISDGEFVTETLSFGSSDSFENVAIGCGHYNWGFKEFDGILGLGWSQLALPAQINSTSFSYCLVNPDTKSSSSTLDFNSAMPADAVVTTMFKNPRFHVYFYVELTGITIGKHKIDVPESVYKLREDGSGGIIIDSGTTMTHLAYEVYEQVRDTFRNYTEDIPVGLDQTFGEFDTCYHISSQNFSTINLPGMSFQFSNGKALALGRENYLWPVEKPKAGKTTVYCFPFMPVDDSLVSIIGNVQQMGMRINYDLENKLIGFSPNKC